MFNQHTNLNFLSLDYLKDLIKMALPDSEINDISPFTCSSPNTVNVFNQVNNADKKYLYFGIFTGDSNIRFVLPRNDAVLEIGIGNNPVPILFFNIDQNVQAGNWIFTGYQITVNTGTAQINSFTPAVVNVFNGTISPVTLFLSNSNNNSTGAPAIAFSLNYAHGADAWRLRNVQSGLLILGNANPGTPNIYNNPLVGTLSLEASHAGAFAELVSCNVNGDIIPFSPSAILGSPVVPVLNKVWVMTISQTMQFNSFKLYKAPVDDLSPAVQIGGELANPATVFNPGDPCTFNLHFVNRADKVNSFVMIQPIQNGFVCPFFFKFFTQLPY